MTRREMIEICVDTEIKRGAISEKSRALQIRARLRGFGPLKPMTKSECELWMMAVAARAGGNQLCTW